MAMVRLEGLCQLQIPMTQLGIEPATFHTNKCLKIFRLGYEKQSVNAA